MRNIKRSYLKRFIYVKVFFFDNIDKTTLVTPNVQIDNIAPLLKYILEYSEYLIIACLVNECAENLKRFDAN